jgi:branched-chain amino acid transport system permease protein
MADLHLNPDLVVFMAVGIVGAAAFVEERLAIRTVAHQDGQLITAVGIATLIQGAVAIIWTALPENVPFFGNANVHVVTFLGGHVYPYTLWLIGLAVVVTLVLYVVLRRTMLGVALLAIAEDREAASVRGINVRILAVGAFAFSGMLAGFFALFIGPHTDATVSVALTLALFGFVAVAIGGFGSLPGGLIGGLIVGMITELPKRYLGPQYSGLLVFAALLLILMIRPGGLFGTFRERVV